MAEKSLNAAILGASGYTGAEAVRLLAGHPRVKIKAVTAGAMAGEHLNEVFPHLGARGAEILGHPEHVNWSAIDVVMSCLPHGTSQDVIEELPERIRVIDLSADYRLRSPSLYEAVYGRVHLNPARTEGAVYGLTELARPAIAGADLVACPGCYPTAALLALIPPVREGVIVADGLIIDAKSGVSGAGRGLKAGSLFCEAAEGVRPYGIASHRHGPEIEQEIARAAGQEAVTVSFTPHLVPMTRGELVTCYVAGAAGAVHASLAAAYDGEPFVTVLPEGAPPPETRHVRGTNEARIAVFPDRAPGRSIIICVIDNLVKGSSGQAVQNLNVMMGWDETLGLAGLTPLFP